jgi:small-conductance mechanosensitive channel/CRP-like cAMP-binding protein
LSTSPKLKSTIQQLALPLIVSIAVLSVFYFGGDAYQAFGIAAVDSTKKFLKYVLGIVAFVAIGLLLNRIVRLVVFEGIILSATGFVVPKLLSQITSLLIFIITVAACANIVFDQDLTVLWAASGVAGLVLGMALKELLQDVFAGIALNIDRSVAIGDFVQIHKAGDDKIVGQLLEISWRSTQIEDTNGEVISFPNSKFSSFTITNFSASKASGRSVSITIDGRVPTARAMRILQSATIDALTEVMGQYGSLPKIGIKAIKNDGVEYLINFESEYQHIAEATWKIQQAVILHLAKAGLKPAGHKTGEDPIADASFAAPDNARLSALISAAPIFRNISTEDLAVLVQHVRLRNIQADKVVVQTGEVGSEMYLVLEGLLYTSGGRAVAHRPSLPSILRPGDLFDAFATLLGNVHTTTVKTRTPSLICEISIAGLQELFNSNPEALNQVAKNLMEQDSKSGMIWDEERFMAMTAQMHHLFPPATVSTRSLQ